MDGLNIGVPQAAGRFDVPGESVTVSEGPPTICETVIVVVAVVPGFPIVGFGAADKTKVP